MLVGPRGEKVVLLSDAGGGNPVSDASVKFDDSAPTFAPDAGVIESISYKPSNYEVGDSVPPPGPPEPYSTSLATFNGADPNGTWSLFINDDTAGNAGLLRFGWALNITTTTGFAIADPGIANRYPAEFEVIGLKGQITKVTAQLNDVAHSWPEDLDVLLVGPTGRTVLLMSDAGGPFSTLYDSRRIIFDDDAAAVLPTGEFPSGTYRPSDYQVGDSFPRTAPLGPYASLAEFKCTNPNGIWKLFVVDDSNPGFAGGILGGFSLNVTSGSPGGCPSADRVRPTARLGVGSKRFRAARRGGPVAKARTRRVGTRVTFRLSEAATARFTVESARRGVRRKGRCLARKRGRRGRRCTRYVARKPTFSRTGKPGVNRFKFTGRLRGRKLAPGSYRLSMVATDTAGNRSKPARATFRIVRR